MALCVERSTANGVQEGIYDAIEERAQKDPNRWNGDYIASLIQSEKFTETEIKLRYKDQCKRRKVDLTENSLDDPAKIMEVLNELHSEIHSSINAQ